MNKFLKCMARFCAVAFAGLWATMPAIADESNTEEIVPEKEKSYVVAPMVISNPNLGSGGGLMGLYFYRPVAEDDTISPPSSVGLLGLYTNTDTYVLGLLNQNYFKEDTWRLKTGILGGAIENDLDVPDFGNVEFSTEFSAIGGSLQKRVVGDFFLGIKGGYSKVDYIEGNALSGDELMGSE